MLLHFEFARLLLNFEVSELLPLPQCNIIASINAVKVSSIHYY